LIHFYKRKKMLASFGGVVFSRSLLNTNILQIEIITAGFHTSIGLESRMKQTARHKPFWHSKKLNKTEDDPLLAENKDFIKQYIDTKYSGPLKEEFAPWSRGKWEPGTRRPGVLARKIGLQPLWLKDGKIIMTTMLHIQDNHVIKYTPRSKYDESYLGQKKMSPSYVRHGVAPSDKLTGFVTVGAVSTDPQKYTKDYCGLFSQSGLAPKRHLARFPVTQNAVIQPGTPIGAAHFVPGQYVDVFGRTTERGFHGVMKRWGFAGMPKTHGVTKSHRRPGNVGMGLGASRIWPGKKMPGHVGGKTFWMRGLKIWRINYAENVIYVSGQAVQGPTGSVLQVSDCKMKHRRWENCVKEGLTDGPRYFPTAYPDQIENLPEEEYFDKVHDFKSPSLNLI